MFYNITVHLILYAIITFILLIYLFPNSTLKLTSDQYDYLIRHRHIKIKSKTYIILNIDNQINVYLYNPITNYLSLTKIKIRHPIKQ